jgi:hypothetical protein
MHIEGTQSSKQMSVGDTDGLASQLNANSCLEAVALINEHENFKGTGSRTTMLVPAESLTEDTQKDHKHIESTIEVSAGSEAPVSCSTASSGGYGISGEDKCVTNTSPEDISVNGTLHGAGNSQGNSGSISVYVLEDKVHAEKLESPSTQKSSDKMVSGLICSDFV